jgi:hypothetical protein
LLSVKEATCSWTDPRTGEVCGSTELVGPDIEPTGEVERREGPGWYEEIHHGRFVLRCPRHREASRETEED